MEHASLTSDSSYSINLSNNFLNFAVVFRFLPDGLSDEMRVKESKGSFVKSQLQQCACAHARPGTT